jgi:glucose-1-phosphate thymidylyltransferase
MKVVLPLAGLGTRLRPHTFTRPKPLLPVAGKPVIAHVLDRLQGLPVSQYIFIVGWLGDQIAAYVRQHYPVPAVFLEQTELKGQAHAVWLARPYIDEPVLILFAADTIIEADWGRLERTDADGVVYVQPVDDPRRFGVVVVENGLIRRLVEKPQDPLSNLAVVGAYYLRDWRRLFAGIEAVMAQGLARGGEYYLADVLQWMVDQGARLRAEPVDLWVDCGTVEALLQANRTLLERGGGAVAGDQEQAVIVPPVAIAPGSRIVRAVVGPYVTVGPGATIREAVVSDSIIGEAATIQSALLRGSIVGPQATVTGAGARLNLGEAASLQLP